jgi:hypothetical protein
MNTNAFERDVGHARMITDDDPARRMQRKATKDNDAAENWLSGGATPRASSPRGTSSRG